MPTTLHWPGETLNKQNGTRQVLGSPSAPLELEPRIVGKQSWARQVTAGNHSWQETQKQTILAEKTRAQCQARDCSETCQLPDVGFWGELVLVNSDTIGGR